MDYKNEILKGSKNDITRTTIQYIINEYFDSLITFICSNDDEKDKVMQIERPNTKNRINTIIRHDLDLSKHVNFEKVNQSIINNTDKGLTKYEKRTRKLIILYIKKMIELYGMENLKKK